MASIFQPLLSAYLLLLLPLVVAQSSAGGDIGVGSSIEATPDAKQWVSLSGDFAFGFHQLENNNDLFILAIWYYKVPSRTVVWYANGDKPAPTRSKIELTDRGLVLTDPKGQMIRRSEFATGDVSIARMNDTGNFVVYGSSSERLWESFGNPTDTLLPTQVMERGGVLSSRHKERNFSKGRFQFRLLPNGNAVLNTINMESNLSYFAYYFSATSDQANSSNSGFQVRLDQDGSFYVLRGNNQRDSLSAEDDVVPSVDYYHRVTLNFDGVLTVSRYPKNPTGRNGNWSVSTTIPDNICTSRVEKYGSGTCGYNSICTLKSDKRPKCNCPPGYSLSDANDEYGNCRADFVQGCETDGITSRGDLYDLVELQNTDWPTVDYEVISPCTVNDCKAYCLQDCLCIVAMYKKGECFKKTPPLPYGRQDVQMNTIAFVKVRKAEFSQKNPPITPPPYGKRFRNSLTILISVFLGSSVLVNFVLVGVLCLGSSFLYHRKIKRNHCNKNGIQSSLRYFNYNELEEATNGFEEELGRGSFGIVYKGVIKTDSEDPIEIAVKKLDRVIQDADKEFRTEVSVIAQTHHRNLVKLLGYCDEGEYRMLVYEYLSNGSLASFLFGELKPSWNQRTEIAVGIARGLCYLHEECSPQIIHCDIKSQNILLNDCYDARISDFGLSKLLGLDQTCTNTAIRGTKGYVAPEWFKSMPVTVKVDVYSFGGVEALMENDPEALSDKMKLERFVMVALWCIQEDTSLRPTMKKVLLMLEEIIMVPALPLPCPSYMLA
ncbi:G-type lectin S-receptor-like serine/threonine-protein kinase LECRK3 [Hibiscus syriacus]|uniref:G-type lectin S-receptor-like serine/threonine-protein kinase LECRK3 n=1 Tax=Hibiscus syriacus TaxID=106335 RepID=UPI0019217738|nr:G-type lectin S-receptor-like serine/threonine-protein kinase LECRK3 [Hibiscus syriacus]